LVGGRRPRRRRAGVPDSPEPSGAALGFLLT
jgi:hypothetical protein